MSTPKQTWVTGRYADRSGMAKYLHLVRAPGDPERRPRPKGGVAERAPHRKLGRTSAAKWEPLLLAALEDGEPRTFNRLGVELFDLTADVICTTPVDTALWNLVDRGLLEHTMELPILFRRRLGAEPLPLPSKAGEQLTLFPESATAT
jgi:hypothetical protein